MNINHQCYWIYLFILVITVSLAHLFTVNNAYASQVYKSIDADGNVTYSSSPPKEATQTEKMDIPNRANSGSENTSNSNIEQIKNLAGEMEKERLQRQDDRAAASKKREEARQKKQAEEAKKQAEKESKPEDRYYPVYIPRRPNRGRPGRPNPELRPQPR